jgi:ribosomal protein L22
MTKIISNKKIKCRRISASLPRVRSSVKKLKAAIKCTQCALRGKVYSVQNLIDLLGQMKKNNKAARFLYCLVKNLENNLSYCMKQNKIKGLAGDCLVKTLQPNRKSPMKRLELKARGSACRTLKRTSSLSIVAVCPMEVA